MRRILRAVLMMLAIPALAACAATGGHQLAANLPDAAPFDESADSATDLEVALASAAQQQRLVLVVFGANWCHDSRGLAGWLETPRFRALTDANYEVVYIEAGVPQTGEGRHLDLAERYGVSDITGTPTLLVISPDGTLLNSPDDARSWRNAASRSEDEIFATLEGFVHTQGI